MDAANKPGPSALAGVLVVDKPEGISSAKAVAVVRRRAGGAKTGHAGTLDPLASGVLVLGLGAATKVLGRFVAAEKRYRTVIDLGAFTTTDDREGPRTEVEVARPPGEAAIREVLSRFVGEIDQLPPSASAIKIGGRRAYKLMREGKEVELRRRPVTVHAIELVQYEWPYLELDIRCGQGTYIRSMARDIGTVLGTGGHCRSLRRTAVGPFTDETARGLDDLPQRLEEGDLMRVEDALEMLESRL